VKYSKALNEMRDLSIVGQAEPIGRLNVPHFQRPLCSFPRALANGRPNSPFLDRYRPDQVG
jgi:hypothetical protein